MADNIITVTQNHADKIIKIIQNPTPNITISQNHNRDGEDFKFEDFTSEQLELLKGPKGDIGEPFRINKAYSSISAMNSDIDNIEDGSFVVISTDTNEDDNGKLYIKSTNSINYLLDLSGVQGIQGPKGDKGDKGEQGSQGVQGVIGPQGIQGDIGPVGPRGYKGDKGDNGDIGPQGIHGEKGDKGDVGPVGPQGIQGPKGKDGQSFTYDMFTEEQLTELGKMDGNAATASKLETPRTISLAGGASGSAIFDGSGDISINTTINTATKATQDGNGANIANTYLKKSGDTVTGALNVPTQATTDNSTKVANTAFVQSAVDSKVSQLVNSAPKALDTLNELSNALGNDPNFATTVTNMIGQKADKTVVDNKLDTHNADVNAHKPITDLINSNQTEVNNNLSTHNTDTSSHEDIRQKFNLYLSKAESEIKLSTHNADVNAHTPILNAIKAISGMSAYDIAPSKTIAAIIPLLGFGGIVAQRLENNGYVKFANGFIIQWGNAGSRVTFPIEFSTNCLNVVATIQTNGDDGNMSKNRLYVNSISNAGFSIQNPQGSYRYFAVGY